ncbi:hypothetical protein MBAV_004800 [Candidatus Magnetobacterium bavaricum]|uniref:Uncharacterized protein n=1 Tax=Candidatus Magnetobacterium bavaricum TaxID=29290 RepID=A0A0F3GM56_9BACT|nr:hypothetical protein MBAV_004800 [Candidatus Magnetobacterium bavaricum]
MTFFPTTSDLSFITYVYLIMQLFFAYTGLYHGSGLIIARFDRLQYKEKMGDFVPPQTPLQGRGWGTPATKKPP